MNCEVWEGHFDNTYPWEHFRLGVTNFTEYYVLKAPDGDDAYNSWDNPNVNVTVNGQLVTSASYLDQRGWIVNKLSDFTRTLNNGNYDAVVQITDIPSFVDSYIVHELWRNSDQRGGFHIYKKRDLPGETGKFYAGPPWDFKASVEYSYDGSMISSMSGSGYTNYFVRLRTNPEFRTAVKNRWQEISPETKMFINEYFDRFITDSEYPAAIGRNNTKWTGWGEWGGRNWNTDAAVTKKWLLDRANWLDVQFSEW
jgi:hypothetical protein